MSAKAKKTALPRPCKTAAKPVPRHGSPGEMGHLTREETTNLVLQAQEAFAFQSAAGRVEPGTKFDDWRREQVEDAVGKPGISKLIRAEWRTVKAHFLILTGREDEAFTLLNKTGVKAYRPVSDQDTWESAETLVALIVEALATHHELATNPIEHFQSAGADAKTLARIQRAQVALRASGKPHIGPGWLLVAARQRTGKNGLTMANLAERLDPQTLTGLLAHLRNHISRREGRADPTRRTARRYPKKPDPGEMDAP